MNETARFALPNMTKVYMQRKIWHALGTSIIPTAYYLETVPHSWALILVAAVAIFTVAGDMVRLKVKALNVMFKNMLEGFLKVEEETFLTGSTFVVIAAAICIAFFNPLVACVAMYFSALGDPVASVVGKGYGQIRFSNGKSLEGSAAMFAVCLMVAIPFFGVGLIALLGALGAALMEFFTGRVDDNLTVPIAGAVALELASWII